LWQYIRNADIKYSTSPLTFQKISPPKKVFRKVRRGEVEYYNSALMIYCIYMKNIPRGEGFVGKLWAS